MWHIVATVPYRSLLALLSHGYRTTPRDAANRSGAPGRAATVRGREASRSAAPAIFDVDVSRETFSKAATGSVEPDVSADLGKLAVYPGNQEKTHIPITLPRESKLPPGILVFAVLVASMEVGGAVAVPEAAINVGENSKTSRSALSAPVRAVPCDRAT